MRSAGKTQARIKSLSTLLEQQPAGVRKDPRFEELVSSLRRSPRLQQLRLNRRCFRLLHEARIADENIENFYRTYRLPRDPFFPLFFSFKREYLAHRAALKQARKAYILRKVTTLPTIRLSFLRSLGQMEKKLNQAGRTPVWDRIIYPDTKKQADAYHSYTAAEWNLLFESFDTALRQRYPRAEQKAWGRIWAAHLLECKASNGRPPPDTVRRQYRLLSRLHHPDAGGDPDYFMQLKEARDLLLGDAG